MYDRDSGLVSAMQLKANIPPKDNGATTLVGIDPVSKTKSGKESSERFST